MCNGGIAMNDLGISFLPLLIQVPPISHGADFPWGIIIKFRNAESVMTNLLAEKEEVVIVGVLLHNRVLCYLFKPSLMS